MVTTQLAPPYPIFTDRDGSPLDAGYLYFGEVNQNPETNPIQVYYDSALTQPAAQPLRTSNGYVMRNGSPALIYAGNQFSVTVRNKKSELVIYSPAGFGVIPFAPSTFATSDRVIRDVPTLLADVQFTYAAGVPNTVQVFPGDILRTLSEGFAYDVAASGATNQHVTTAGGVKLYVQPSASGVNIDQFGIVGDGIADDGPTIQKALQYCSNTGTPFQANGGSTYRVATSITVNRSSGQPMVIDWGGATVVCDEASGPIFTGPSTAYLNTTLVTEIDRDDSFIHLASVTGIAKGDLIEVLSPALTHGNVGTYHYYVVNEIDGNNVYIEGTTVADVKAQQIIDSGQTGSITVAAYKLAPQIVMKNATFEMVNATGASYFCAYFRWHSSAIVNNITFTGNGRFQLGCDYTGQLDVGSCTFRDFGYTEMNSGYISLPSSPDGLSFGYGILVVRTWQALIHDCVGLRGWHTVDFSRGSMKALVSNCSFSRNAYGVSGHEGSWHVEVRGCMFDGTASVLLGRSTYVIVEGCHFKGMTEHGVVYGDQVVDVRVSNNKFEYNPGVVSTYSAIRQSDDLTPTAPGAGSLSTGFNRTFECTGNTVIGKCRCQAGFNDSSQGRLVVANNQFFDGAEFTNIYAGKQTLISNNTFANIQAQFAITLRAGSGNPSIVCTANVHMGAVGSYGASALIALSGSNAPVVHLENNSSLTQYLLRFDNNLTVKSVVNCVARSEGLFIGTGTVTNAINNYYVTAISALTTVTNSVNNQALV